MRPRYPIAAVFLAAAMLVAACEPASREALTVFVPLPDQTLANATKATVLVDYSGTEARILSDGGSPACAFVLPGIDGDFSDDRNGTLTIRTSGRRALRGTADIVACQMEASRDDATAADLRSRLSVRVAGAEDATGKAIDTTVKPARSPGASPVRTESAIEAAQAEAAKTAAAISAAAPPPAPVLAPGAAAGSVMPRTTAGAGNANAPMPLPGNSGPGRAGTGGSGAIASGGAVASNVPQANTGGNVDNSPAPNNQDADPGYDDSPSDDERVPAYTLEFAVTSAGRIGALQLEVTHLGSSGGFIGRGDKIDCVALVDALVASNYLGERTAKIGLISLQGIPSPAPLMRCGFRTREAASSPSFLVQVVDASSPGGDPIDPPPNVLLSVSRR